MGSDIDSTNGRIFFSFINVWSINFSSIVRICGFFCLCNYGFRSFPKGSGRENFCNKKAPQLQNAIVWRKKIALEKSTPPENFPTHSKGFMVLVWHIFRELSIQKKPAFPALWARVHIAFGICICYNANRQSEVRVHTSASENPRKADRGFSYNRRK